MRKDIRLATNGKVNNIFWIIGTLIAVARVGKLKYYFQLD
jgi:hypothetical protein